MKSKVLLRGCTGGTASAWAPMTWAEAKKEARLFAWQLHSPQVHRGGAVAPDERECRFDGKSKGAFSKA